MLKLLTLVVATATTLVAGQTYIVGFDDLDAVKQRTNYEVDTRNGLFYVNFCTRHTCDLCNDVCTDTLHAT